MNPSADCQRHCSCRLPEVAGVDLRQRRVLRVAEVAAIRAPFAFGACALLAADGAESGREHETDDCECRPTLLGSATIHESA